MLLRFRAKNFKSLKDDNELSLIGTGAVDEGYPSLSVNGELRPILSAAAIYGANASGKSNFINAIAHFRNEVANSHKRRPKQGLPHFPFILDAESEASPSEFEIDFLISGIRHRYGFVHDASEVLEEWLYVYPSGRPQEWFYRGRTKNSGKITFTFGRNLKGKKQTIAELTKANSLFLSTAAQNNHRQLTKITNWITNAIRWTYPDDHMMRARSLIDLTHDDSHMNEITAFLKAADLGISGYEVNQIDLSEMSQEVRQAFNDFLRKVVGDDEEDFDFNEIMSDPPNEIRLLHTTKDKTSVAIEPEFESRGTKNYLAYVTTIIGIMETGGVFVVDELEASLHPMLARNLVALFGNKRINKNNAQIIFSTHSTNLLRDGILGRDQIWFTEKDHDGISHLYPLSDYSPRKGENLERGYLQGRYGAIPYLGDFEVLGASDGKTSAPKR